MPGGPIYEVRRQLHHDRTILQGTMSQSACEPGLHGLHESSCDRAYGRAAGLPAAHGAKGAPADEQVVEGQAAERAVP
jgi:hypothetical protein